MDGWLINTVHNLNMQVLPVSLYGCFIVLHLYVFGCVVNEMKDGVCREITARGGESY